MGRFAKFVVGSSKFVVALFLFSFLFAGIVRAQNANDFEIKSFDADYFLNRNEQKTSVLNVIERITAQFPLRDQNHGILRAVPKSYDGHTLSLSVESVKDQEGNKIPFDRYEQGGNEVLKIGDADRYVHGEQQYIIRYTLRNVVKNFPGHDEFYWDVNGDQWGQTFDSVEARLHIPNSFSENLLEPMACYSGSFGSTSQDFCSISRTEGGSENVITAKTTQPLGAYQTLTMVVGFDPGTFLPGPEIAREQLNRKIIWTGIAAAVVLPPLLAFLFMFRRWRQFGDDPKGRGVIVPEYEPPKNFNSLTSDFLLAQKLRNNAFSAALVELAISRYLNIHEIPKKGLFGKNDYELELLKSPADLPKEQQMVLEMVFSATEPGARVKISDIKKSTSLRSSITSSMKKLENYLASELHKRGYFVKNPKKVKRGYLVWASALLTIGFLGILFLPLAPIGIGLVLAALVTYAFAFYMPARTEAGVLAHDALLGLKDYMKLAEKDRLNFGQSPEGAEKVAAGSFDPNDPKKKVKLFESLLPYSMLFGLEKNWAKQFEDIYKEPPDWYSGSSGVFTAAYLGSSLGGFSSVSATTFTSPSSSSGSGFSGGSAGGGGGGGGGGGW